MSTDWITDCDRATAGLTVSDRIAVENLELTVSAREQNLVDWVPAYLDPLVQPADGANRDNHFSLSCVYSDDNVSRAIARIDDNSRPARIFEATCAVTGVLRQQSKTKESKQQQSFTIFPSL